MGPSRLNRRGERRETSIFGVTELQLLPANVSVHEAG